MSGGAGTVLVIDSQVGIGRALASAFLRTARLVLFNDGDTTTDEPDGYLVETGFPASIDLVLYHQGAEAALAQVKQKARVRAAVWYTSGGMPDAIDVPGRHGLLARPMERGRLLTEDEAADLLAWVKRGRRATTERLPSVMRRPCRSSGYLPALAVLCRGYLATGRLAGALDPCSNDRLATAFSSLRWDDIEASVAAAFVNVNPAAIWAEVQGAAWWRRALTGRASSLPAGIARTVREEATRIGRPSGGLEGLMIALASREAGAVHPMIVASAYLELVALDGQRSSRPDR